MVSRCMKLSKNIKMMGRKYQQSKRATHRMEKYLEIKYWIGDDNPYLDENSSNSTTRK